MEAQQHNRKYTYKEYLDIDQQSALKHEFYYGDVYAMTGGTLRHTEIIANLVAVLRPKMKLRGCKVYPEARLEAKHEEVYFFPDVMVSCNEKDTKSPKNVTMKYPGLLIEVLSNSTKNFDKTKKLEAYRKLPSLFYYLTIEQVNPDVEVHSKAGDIWRKDTYTSMDNVIDLPLLELQLPLGDIYDDIIFDKDL